jgi:Outer membrane lipoprotein-sorting protein
MKLLGMVWMAVLIPALSAQIPDVHSLMATARQRMEATDFRASGHLVWVQANGTRISHPITIEARWFPGVLRVKAETSGESKSFTATGAASATHVLIELRPDGKNAIWIAHPGDKSPAPLAFDKWNQGPLGPTFGYEDFLEEEIFWPNQTLAEKAKFGARDCDVIKNTPGPGDRTHYSEVKAWIDPAIAFPVYVEKTVKGTGAVKEFTYYGLMHEGGMWAAHQIEMKTRGQSGSTLLIFDRGSPKANLTLKDFSPETLTHF